MATHGGDIRIIDHLTKFRSAKEQRIIDLIFDKLLRGDRQRLEHSLRNKTAASLRRRGVLKVERARLVMHVIVCGGRTFDNYAAVKKYLDMLYAIHGFTLVIHGRAKGADTCAHRWAGEHGVPVEMFPAHWRLHGNAAGPIRNKQMLDEGRPQLVVAFPGGDGTRNMMKQAHERGVEVIDLEHEAIGVRVTAIWKAMQTTKPSPPR
ncbi:DUF2493 domain-containing protein [Bradyrhizobium liaoningense]|uniref:DUF2493 domain-containing protein n=1 Tax=Bradyrhizobium liaoningense TaxID=43992 RepID=UPI001BAC3096|nr:DUF2493 domain-containing protein [Bradyrhizobium liaoningense]MBR0741172.1 DUF2493 domain-containing protein [Bradyrhizobium liaoningense]